MAKEFLEVSVTLDTGEVKKGLLAIEKQAKETSDSSGGELSGGFNKAALAVTGINQALELANKAFQAVVKTGETLFNQVLKGEEIDAIGRRFEILADTAGQYPNKLIEGIERAVDGTVDMEDALNLASESLVKLGNNGDKIPQIFELSKKAALVFGGTTEQAFEKLSTAIATGQTRQLRSLGLLIDANKAQSEYAKSIGLTSDVLTEEQRALATFNAVLDASNKKFAGISGSLTPVAESFKQFKVQLGEVFDSIALAFNNLFGGVVKRTLDAATVLFKNTAESLKQSFSEPVKGISSDIQTLENRLNTLNRQLNNSTDANTFTKLQSQIAATEEKLNEFYQRKAKLDQIEAARAANADQAPQQSIGSQLSPEAIQKRLQSEQELNNQTLALQQQNIQAQLNNADFLGLSLIDKKNLYLQQITLETEIFNQKIAEIDERYANQGLAVQQAADNLKLEQRRAYEQKILQIQEKSQKDQEEKLKNLKEIWQQSKKDAKSIFIDGIGNAFEGMGKALAKGENAWIAFKDGFKKILADIASATGDVFIGQGIGYLAAGNIASGLGLIAAGASLKVLAGFLGGSTSSNATPVTNVDNASSTSSSLGSTGTSLASSSDRREPETKVTINVQGSYFDTAEAATRMIDLMNEQFDTTGRVLFNGATA